MGTWYCHVGGQQYGPVDEAVLRQWLAEGRLHAEDMVWSPGLDVWLPAREAFGLGYADSSSEPGAVSVGSIGGTGGMTGATALMGMAWRSLRGRWGMAVAFNVLFLLIFFGIGLVDGAIETALNLFIPPLLSARGRQFHIQFDLVQLALEGALTLGATVFYLTYYRRGAVSLKMLFVGFRRYLATLGLHILQTLLIILFGVLAGLPGGIVAALLFFVGGERDAALWVVIFFSAVPFVVAAIIAALRYSQAFYVLAENPRVGVLGSLRRSVQIMKGNKLRLFGMQLLFGLVIFGCAIAICVGWVLGLLFVLPWMFTAQAAFYDDLKPPRSVPGSVMTAAPNPFAAQASG